MSAATRLRGSAALLLLALCPSLVSCAHWRRQWVAPEMVVDQDRPGQLRLTRKDGARFVLRNPAVVQDSLVGDSGGKRLAVPLAEVDHVSLRRGSSLLPATLIPLGVIFGFGVLIAATWD